MSSVKDRPMYAFLLEAPQGDSDSKKSPLSGDIEASELIRGSWQTQCLFIMDKLGISTSYSWEGF